MRSLVLGCFLSALVFTLLVPSRAFAQRSELASPPPAVDPHGVWYGYETLLVDASSIATGLGVGLANPAAGGLVFAGGYTLGGPIVHLGHGRPRTALASLGLRLGLPVAGTLLASMVLAAGDRSSDDGVFLVILGGFIGGSAGGVAAMTLDAAVLARTGAADSAPAKSALTWAPSFAPLRGGGMTAGVSGTF